MMCATNPNVGDADNVGVGCASLTPTYARPLGRGLCTGRQFPKLRLYHRCHVITGASGGGKSTLVATLKNLGYSTYPRSDPRIGFFIQSRKIMKVEILERTGYFEGKLYGDASVGGFVTFFEWRFP
jgi:hypothetical protein